MVDQPKFKSVRTDPVSGNEVPIGSTPDEVRDDIPAALSEGEYVVPADVVRYYGVKFFEDLRNEAKSGWSDMEANGRVGGEPMGMEMGGDELPFDVSELQMMDDGEPEGMYEGGYMAGYNTGSYAAPAVPDNMAELRKEFPASFVGGPNQAAEEYRTYQNAEGMTITIRFINGKPVTPIPEGYTEADSAEEAVAPSSPAQSSSDDDEGLPVEFTDIGNQLYNKEKESIDWDTASSSDFNNTMANMYGSTGSKAKSIASAINPILGIGIGVASRHQEKKMLEALNKRIKAGETDLIETRDRLNSYIDRDGDGERDSMVQRSGIFGGGKSMTDKLTDTSGDGKVDFADTWLGDLLGFDGTAGVQGANLSDSRAGARRNLASQFDFDSSEFKDAQAAANAASQPEDTRTAAEATSDWVAATNAAKGVSTDDPAAWTAAIRAQSEASKAATKKIQEESGWTGFFSPPKD